MADSEATPAPPAGQPANTDPVQQMTNEEQSRQRTVTSMMLRLVQGGAKIHAALNPNEAGMDDDMDDGFDDMEDDDFDDDDTQDDEGDYEDIQAGDEPLDETSVINSSSATAAVVGATVLGGAALAAATARGPNDQGPAAKSNTVTPKSTNPTQPPSTTPKSVPQSAKASKEQSPKSIEEKKEPASDIKAISQTPAVHKRSSSLKATITTSDAINVKTDTKAPEPATKNVQSVAKPAEPVKKPAPKVDPLAPTAAAPYGHKAVKVRKPDGTIATVKRPLKAEEAAKLAEEKAKAASKNKTTAQANATDLAISEKLPPLGSTPSTRTTTVTGAAKTTKDNRQVTVNEKEINIGTVSEPLTPARTDTAQSKSSGRLHRMTKFMNALTWFVMIAFPLVFLALGIAVAAMTNKHLPGTYAETLKNTDVLTQARNVAVSMWPIVFAAILAQTLRAYAAFKVERGIPLVTLEQLISSNSVAGAVKQPFLLRTFNLTSIALLVVWALSPLAGQGIVRMGHIAALNITQGMPVQYFAPQKMDYDVMEFAEVPSTNIYHISQVDAIFTGLLVGNNGSRYAPQDFWLNVKVPLYNASSAAHVNNGNITYAMSDYAAGHIGFTGLSGIPVWLPDNSYPAQTSRFEITTSHYVLDCTALTSYPVDSDFIKSKNLTVSPSGTLWLSAENQTTMYDNTQAQEGEFIGPGDSGVIHFGSTDRTTAGQSKSLYYSECKYHQELTTSGVDCVGVRESANCYVSSQVPVTVDPTQQSPFQPLGKYFSMIMRHCGGNSINESTVTESEQYIRNPAFASSSKLWNSTTDSLVNITAAQMSKNFGVLINTLWLAGTKHKALLGGDLNAVFVSSGYVFPIQNITADAVIRTVGQYKTNWPWCIVLIVCSVLLLVAGVIAVSLEGRTIGPDFLGFANTAVRKGVRLPRHMNNLSARERLHALNEAEVLLQDVRPNDDRGRMALGIKDENSVRLVKNRVYR